MMSSFIQLLFCQSDKFKLVMEKESLANLTNYLQVKWKCLNNLNDEKCM
jgi:hypothetical protein